MLLLYIPWRIDGGCVGGEDCALAKTIYGLGLWGVLVMPGGGLDGAVLLLLKGKLEWMWRRVREAVEGHLFLVFLG